MAWAMMVVVELAPLEIRILGCLAEKAVTTPDNYPLSTNALVNACNQTSNRDPVMAATEREVDQAVLALRTAGLARTVTGGRTNKHRHVVDEAWGLDPAETAVLGVLFLRGAQTTGELRGRTERWHHFADLDEVEDTLERLAARPDPLVRQSERMPGQKERRWTHLCGQDGEPAPVQADVAPPPQSATRPSPIAGAGDAELAALRTEVDELRRAVDRLYELLGETRGQS